MKLNDIGLYTAIRAYAFNYQISDQINCKSNGKEQNTDDKQNLVVVWPDRNFTQLGGNSCSQSSDWIEQSGWVIDLVAGRHQNSHRFPNGSSGP